MARKVVSQYVVDRGVGIKWPTNKHGWGLETVPYLAVLHHPVLGQTSFGPFVDEHAAHEWVRHEGDGQAMEYYGERQSSQWFVVALHVPTHEKRK